MIFISTSEELLYTRKNCLLTVLQLIVFTLIMALATASHAVAQGITQTVTLKVKDERLEKVFAAIEKQTGYVFFYDRAIIKNSKPVSYNVVKERISKVLDELFKGQGLGYLIENKTITISTKKVSSPVTAAPDPLLGTPVQNLFIRGHVVNKNGNALPYVTIVNHPKDAGQKLQAFSRSDGSFTIRGEKGDVLTFTSIGYKTDDIKYNGEASLKVTLEEDLVDLEGISVSDENPFRKKVRWTDTVDMKHRTHMTLGALLQGSVPGLTLQNANANQKTLSSITVNGSGNYSVDQVRSMYLVALKDKVFEGSFEEFLVHSAGDVTLNYSNGTSNNGLVPQLRGVNGFNGNTSGMLIVIDGFPQEGFPADYPMANVESVRVVKDPEELTKWGPQAAGGAVLITTKQAVAGKLQLSYNSNFYYSAAPRFHRDKLQLASSADWLDYLKNANDSGFLALPDAVVTPIPYGLSYPELLLFNLKNGTLSQTSFAAQWDSLGGINNEDQLKLLQQDIFNQNQSLRLSGGSKGYRFTATGIYNTSRTNAVGNNNRMLGLLFNNQFSLLHNKLRGQWNINLSGTKANAGYLFDPVGNSLAPYQLLLGQHGDYIYDYTSFNPAANDILRQYGYANYGVNLLQDARVNSNRSKAFRRQSMLNFDWDLLPGLKWTNSLQYNLNTSNNESLQGAESSNVRQLVNDYGSPVVDGSGNVTGIDFYVPQGGIFNHLSSRTTNWNIRSALLFNKSFGKNKLSVTLGGGAFGGSARTPSYSTVYGYNSTTGQGQAVQLPAPDPNAGIANFNTLPGLKSNAVISTLFKYPYTLYSLNAGNTNLSRGLNGNGNLRYAYDSVFTLEGNYNSVLSPNYGYSPSYTNLSFYTGEAGLRIDKLLSLRLPNYISNVIVSSGVNGTEIPNLPTQINAIRTLQSTWNNYGIWINNYNTARQEGQTIKDIYEKLTVGLFGNQVVTAISYHSSSIDSLQGKVQKNIQFIAADATMRLRKDLLYFKIGYLHSPEGDPQTNLRIGYNIAKESYFNSPTISTLSTDFSLQNISPYQAMQLMVNTNTAMNGGGFSTATVSSFGLLPPAVKNMEVHAAIGILQDRYLIDLRYYKKNTSGLNNEVPVPSDPSTGLGTRVTYSEIVNKGIEVYFVIKAVEQKQFKYKIILNGAYNKNLAQSVPLTNFSQTASYLTAYRDGYSTENLWSYRWAGLDNNGNPQIYTSGGQKVMIPDSATLANSLVYSGVTRAPYTGGLIQDWNWGHFFARAAVVFNLGHVMRAYMPSPSGVLDNSSLISQRWRKAGDEQFTDIPAMANTNVTSTRTFITQNSSNSILPADNLRIQEVQIGWEAPRDIFQNLFIKNLMVSLQVQNLAVLTRNGLHVDPETISNTGRIGLTRSPRQYSLSMKIDF